MDNRGLAGVQVEFEILDDEQISIPATSKGPSAMFHATRGRPAEIHRRDRCDPLNDLEDLHLITVPSVVRLSYYSA